MKIITITSGDTIFLEIQYHTLKENVKEIYEFLVFNACVKKKDLTNCYNENVYDEISDFCKNKNINFINLLNNEEQIEYDNMESVSYRHSYVLKKVVKYMKDNPDEYLMMDSDMFLIDTLDINDLRKYECAGVLQQRGENGKVSYFWPGLFYINIKKCKNLDKFNDFDCGMYNNERCDTGGGTSIWLNSLKCNIPKIQEIRNEEIDKYNNNGIKFIKHLCSCSWDKTEYPSNLKDNILQFCIEDVRNMNNKFFCEIFNNNFLHFRCGTNWLNNMEISIKMKNKLKDVIMADIVKGTNSTNSTNS